MWRIDNIIDVQQDSITRKYMARVAISNGGESRTITLKFAENPKNALINAEATKVLAVLNDTSQQIRQQNRVEVLEKVEELLAKNITKTQLINKLRELN